MMGRSPSLCDPELGGFGWVRESPEQRRQAITGRVQRIVVSVDVVGGVWALRVDAQRACTLRSLVGDQCSLAPRDFPPRLHVELLEPAFDILRVDFIERVQDRSDGFIVLRTPGDQLVDDQILGPDDEQPNSLDHDLRGTRNGRLFERRARYEQIDARRVEASESKDFRFLCADLRLPTRAAEGFDDRDDFGRRCEHTEIDIARRSWVLAVEVGGDTAEKRVAYAGPVEDLVRRKK